MARAPFKLRSGNASAFKNLGSSPAKQQLEPKPGERGDTLEPKSQSGEGKAMKTGKKIPTINVPKDHPVTPPTTEQSKKSKGTLKGKTGFEYDVVDPVKSKVRQGVNLLKTNVIAKGQQKINETILKGGKKVYDYFTKK